MSLKIPMIIQKEIFLSDTFISELFYNIKKKTLSSKLSA